MYYTNAKSLGNKQEEIELVIYKHSFDLAAITDPRRMMCMTECLNQWL